jgi:hypothetical protein
MSSIAIRLCVNYEYFVVYDSNLFFCGIVEPITVATETDGVLWCQFLVLQTIGIMQHSFFVSVTTTSNLLNITFQNWALCTSI